MRLSVHALIMLIVACSGCMGPMTYSNEPLRRPQKLESIGSDGVAILSGQVHVTLVGIRMRPVEETREPDALEQVRRIVGRDVDVFRIGTSKFAVLNYRQHIGHRTQFLNLMPATGPNYALGNLSLLLISLGLARFDAGAGSLELGVAEELRDAQQEYDWAVLMMQEYVPVSLVAREPWRAYLETRYVPRVASGDQRCQCSQCWEYRRRMELN